MSVNLNLFRFIFLLILITQPFNSYKSLLTMGEMSHEMWFYISLVTFPLLYKYFFIGLGTHTKQLTYIYLFLLLLLLSSLFNIYYIDDYSFKEKLGYSRLFTQIILVSYMFIFFFITRGAILKYGLDYVFKILLYGSIISFVIVLLYSLIELFQFKHALQELKFFIDNIIRDEIYMGYTTQRLRGVSFEAPFLGYYLSGVMPFFLFMLYSKQKTIGFILVIFALLLGILSDSRFAQVVLLIEIILFVLIYLRVNLKQIFIARFIFIVLFSILFIFISLYFSEKFSINAESSHTVSNITRFGTLWALLNIYFENPFFGIGFGQSGFVISNYYPAFAFTSHEIQNFVDPLSTASWPPLYNAYARLLAELGIGGIIFIFICLNMLMGFYKFFLKTKDIKYLALLIFAISSCLSFMQFDTLRTLNFWISLAFFTSIVSSPKKN